MNLLENPVRGTGLTSLKADIENPISCNVASVLELLKACPAFKPTPMVNVDSLAHKLGVAAISIKDERTRMGLGSFKALGAAYSIAKTAVAANGGNIECPEVMSKVLDGSVFVTASAGNHGVSTAAGARIFGARAVIYLSETVPTGFADKLRDFGANVVVEGANYEESHEAAMAASVNNGWTLIADSTWVGYNGGRDIMEGYLAMPAEAVDQLDDAPTHIFLQAGVGGLAAAAAVHARVTWGNGPHICVVEPTVAPALMASVEAGRMVHAPGPVSNMGRLDCKEPSLLALDYLSREADTFMLVDDAFVSDAIEDLKANDLETSPSGGAGYAGLVAATHKNALGLGPESRVLLYLSEGPSDD